MLQKQYNLAEIFVYFTGAAFTAKFNLTVIESGGLLFEKAMSTAILDQIAKEVASCTRCSLCKTRTKTVPGEGSPQARVLFIGEAPGYHEDQQGRPFVGQSGQLLTKLLNLLKIPREEVFIANVVKCRPPGNADPTPEQIAACKPFLDRQIAAINPKLVVTLGRFSMARYWPGQRISQIHGRPKEEGGRIYMPMFHPAAALRDDRTKQLFKEDGLTIPDLLERAEEIARTELWGFGTPDAEEPAPAQPVLAERAPVPKVAGPTNGATPKILKEEPAPPLAPVPIKEKPKAVAPAKAVLEAAPPPKDNGLPPALEVALDDLKSTGENLEAENTTGILTANNETAAVPTRKSSGPGKSRKKREPGIGEQLTMF